MNGTCKSCAKCEAHGYPRRRMPEWYCFTVHYVCSAKGEHTNPRNTCGEYEPGEPRKVADDVG